MDELLHTDARGVSLTVGQRVVFIQFGHGRITLQSGVIVALAPWPDLAVVRGDRSESLHVTAGQLVIVPDTAEEAWLRAVLRTLEEAP